MRHTVLRQPIGLVAAIFAVEFSNEFPRPASGGRTVRRLRHHFESLRGDARRGGAAGARLPGCRRAAGVLNLVFGNALGNLRVSDTAAGGAPGDVHRLDSQSASAWRRSPDST